MLQRSSQTIGTTLFLPIHCPTQLNRRLDDKLPKQLIFGLWESLYCLLFGRVPFDPPDQSEFTLYRLICEDDWGVMDTMGSDKIPTHGRRPRKMYKETDGYAAVRLLERVMKKDPAERIGLDQVKVRFLNRPFLGYRSDL